MKVGYLTLPAFIALIVAVFALLAVLWMLVRDGIDERDRNRPRTFEQEDDLCRGIASHGIQHNRLNRNPGFGATTIRQIIDGPDVPLVHEYQAFDLDTDTPEPVQHFAERYREAQRKHG